MATEINRLWNTELSEINWQSYIAVPLLYILRKYDFFEVNDSSHLTCSLSSEGEKAAKLKLAMNFLRDAGLLIKNDGSEKQTYLSNEIDLFGSIVLHWANLGGGLNALVCGHKQGVTLLKEIRDRHGVGHAYDLGLQFNNSVFIVNFYRLLASDSSNSNLDFKDHSEFHKTLCEVIPCLLNLPDQISAKEIYHTLKASTALVFLSDLGNLDVFFSDMFSSNAVNSAISYGEKNQYEHQVTAELSLFAKIERHTSKTPFAVTVEHLISFKNQVSSSLFFLLELRCFNTVPSGDFLQLAASFGLFSEQYIPELSLGRYRWNTVSRFLQRSYSICRAEYGDLDRLFELETCCWEGDLAQTREAIARRISNYPEGQFVLKYNNLVVGVIYSQKIKDFNLIKNHNANNVYLLHDEAGSIIQLLAINVAPDSQNLRLGDQLLDFMLQKCAFTSGVDSVVGITLCKSFHKQSSLGFDEYIQQCNEYGGYIDPILHFHQSHGAKVLGSIINYREKDYKNIGRGVLVYYDMRHWNASAQLLEQRNVRGVHNQQNIELIANNDLLVSRYVKDEILHCLPEMKNEHFLDDIPLMEMGLDSADFMILQAKFAERFNIRVGATFFFKYNTVEKVISFLNDELKKINYSLESSSKSSNTLIADEDSLDGCSSGEDTADKDIAIIGAACRLPGEINDLESFWEALRIGANKIEARSDDRLNLGYANINGDEIQELNYGGFLKDIDCFDADFFRVSPKEAIYMDPQQRIMLELTWEAIEAAGVSPEGIKNNSTGVFIGASGSDYSKLIIEQRIDVEAQMATGCSTAILANRISYFLNASGPSVLVDTACSSSLVAVHQAVHSLRSGECQQAFAGGINIMLHYSSGLAYFKSGMLSKDGRCYCFDERANGYVRSEGAGVIFIKHLKDAVEAKDNILAVIKGSACSHAGVSAGLTVPSSEAQAKLILDAWKDARISGEHVSFIEAHGTGTPLGDPIEIEGISAAIVQARNGKIGKKVAVGSVKSNIGHLEAAAGVAGLLKVVLALKHKMLPPVANYKIANPKLELSTKPVEIVSNLVPWNETNRVAGISSFGSGGTNCHIVLQEYIQSELVPSPATTDGEFIFLLSAQNVDALMSYVFHFKKYLDGITNNIDLVDICNTLLQGRKIMQFRMACVVSDLQDLHDKLTVFSIATKNYSQTKMVSKENYVKLFNSFFSKLKGDSETLNRLALEWVAGGDVVAVISPHSTWKRLNLPVYPFQRKRYWIRNIPSTESAAPDSILGREIRSERGETVFANTWHVVPNFMKYYQKDFQCISLGFVVEMLVLAAGKIKGNAKHFSFINMKFRPHQIDNAPINLETIISIFNEKVVIELVCVCERQRFLIARAELLGEYVNENDEVLISPELRRNNLSFQSSVIHSYFLKNIAEKNVEYKFLTPINSINEIFPSLAERLDEYIHIYKLNVAAFLENTNLITTYFNGDEISLYGEQCNLIANLRC